MNAVKTRTTAPAITVCNGLATVLTTNISAVFEKNHRHVLRDVEDIIQRTPEDRRGNFIPVELERPSNLGKGIVKYKAYALTKAGFTFLAMGFTGEKADKFKWAYIDEFDRMEKALSGEGGPDYIDEAQQREIQKAVGRRASGAPKNFRVIYSALKDHFRIPRYTCLQKKDFEAALALIETCTLKPQLSAPAIPEGSIVIDEAMAEKIVVFIYYWRYLFRDDLNLFLALLRRVKSPLAAHFWEAVNDLGLGFMEDALAKQGYSVKDLSCYQHWASQQPKRLTA